MEPILIGSVDISRAGKNCKILLGDIDGDGRMELVCVQPDGGIDDRYVLSGDLFGRGCEDAVIYADGKARIYSGLPYDMTRKPSGRAITQPGRLYRSTLYPGCVYEE